MPNRSIGIPTSEDEHLLVAEHLGQQFAMKRLAILPGANVKRLAILPGANGNELRADKFFDVDRSHYFECYSN